MENCIFSPQVHMNIEKKMSQYVILSLCRSLDLIVLKKRTGVRNKFSAIAYK